MIEHREIIQHVLVKKLVDKHYIDAFKDTYDGMITSVRII